MIKRYSKRGEKTAVGRNFAVGYIDKSKRKKKPKKKSKRSKKK